MERVRTIDLNFSENEIEDVKKYGTDISLYVASNLCVTDENRKYFIKAILHYPFSQDPYAAALWGSDPYYSEVPTYLLDWLKETDLEISVRTLLEPYLWMIHSTNVTDSALAYRIESLLDEMLEVCTRRLGIYVTVAVLKHMKEKGTLDLILPLMKNSTMFGMRFLHAWFAGSLRSYIEQIEEWRFEYSRWLSLFFQAITDKARVRILTGLPWTHNVVLLQICGGHFISYALDILPSSMRNCVGAVPSLLSISLVRTVAQCPTSYVKGYLTIGSFEELQKRVPHDLAEAIPLVLILLYYPDVLRSPHRFFGSVLMTCFGWFAREQLLSLDRIAAEAMVCWHQNGFAFSDRQLLVFANKSPESVEEFLLKVHETLPARQVTLLRKTEFERRMRKRHLDAEHDAKRLQMTDEEFLKWSETTSKELWESCRQRTRS